MHIFKFENFMYVQHRLLLANTQVSILCMKYAKKPLKWKKLLNYYIAVLIGKN